MTVNGAHGEYSPTSWLRPAARSIRRRCCYDRRMTIIRHGLANGSDVVGRHYMGHVNSVLMAISKCPNPTIFQKTLSVNDYYFGSPEWKYPMGHISFVGKLDGETLKAGAPAIAPGFTLDLMAKHSLDFWLTREDLPDPKNRVTLDRDGNIVLELQAE